MIIEMIVLAAGNSRRFGSNKLLYEIDGVPMYSHIFQQLTKVRENFNKCELETGIRADQVSKCSKEGEISTENNGNKVSVRISVVTQYEEIASSARDLGMKVLYNLNPELGISSSLKIGLQASRDADACLFAVSDQPWLSEKTIEDLIHIFVSSGKGIACVCSDSHQGNPCIFSQKYYPELLALTGDMGGKRVVSAHPEDTVLLEVSDKKDLTDIDIREKKNNRIST